MRTNREKAMLLHSKHRAPCDVRITVNTDKALAELVHRERQRIQAATGANVSVSQTIAALIRRALEQHATA